jgi:2-methylfumaryl-CoA hydratase
MGKERSGRSFEDFEVGSRVECPGARKITDSDRASWIGLTGDGTPRFSDGSTRVHPLLVFNLAHGMVSRALLQDAREELGISGLVPHRPVPVGAILHATARVIGLREDPTHDAGVVWIRVAARDARGVVLSYVFWFRIAKRHRQGKERRDALPTLGDGVPLRDIHTATLGDLPQPHETGGRFLFDDYVPGETLFHDGATTVDDHDIRAFARWFRVPHLAHHLPGHANHGAASGQALGLTYALAYDGLQNRIGLGGIHAMRTPHRVQSGDVLRAMSQVVAVEDLGPAIGAVRLRTYLFRNRLPMNDDPPLITDGKRYYGHIALDMDYWELLPRRRGGR